jgi:predicted component of type VI protein secretion system
MVLNDPSVDPLHARLIRQDDGAFRLSDEGSVAGTWVNYILVSPDGASLEHGDLLHIGRVTFRFSLRQVKPARKPVAVLLEEQQEVGS